MTLTRPPSEAPSASPAWRSLLRAMALVQWGIAAMLFAPLNGWQTLTLLPLELARLAAPGLAVLLSAAALRPSIASPLRRAIQTRPGRPIALGLAAACAALGAYALYATVAREAYVTYHWPGQTLAGLQWLLAAAFVATAALKDSATSERSWQVWLSLAALALGLGLRLWALLTWDVEIDEGFHLSAAQSMVAGHGIAPAAMFLPAGLPIAPWRGYAFGVYGLWARLFGIGLRQARALAYLIGLLALPPIYDTARRRYGRPAAWATLGIAALSILFQLTTTARTDSLPLLAVSLAVWAHVAACQRVANWPHLGVGLLAVLALEAHFVNLIFLFALGMTYLADYVGRVRARRHLLQPAPLWFFLMAALPAFALYVTVHVLLLPYPGGLFASTSAFAPSGGSLIVWGIVKALRLVWDMWWNSPPDTLLIALSALAAGTRRTDADRRWLTLLAFTVLGYLGIEVIGSIYHLSYGLPIFLGSAGALVTHGFHADRPLNPVRRGVAFAGVALALAANTAGTIRLHSAWRVATDAVRQPVAQAVRQHVPPDAAIIALPEYYPYLVDEYRTFLHPYYPAVARGPALAGMSIDAYWQNVLLETWPAARIVTPDFPLPPLELYDSYMLARHAEEIVPDLWLAGDGDLVTDAPYGSPSQAALQMVAHAQPQPPPQPGSTLELHTLWVTRGPVRGDYRAALALLDAGPPVAHSDVALVSGWAGTPTSQWTPYAFHDVALALPLPADLPPGTYTLRLSLSGPSGQRSACQPACDFVVDEVAVAP